LGLLFTRFITRLAIVATATGVVTERVEFADSPERAYALKAKAEIFRWDCDTSREPFTAAFFTP
jgi:hypothetical protein